MTAVIDGMDADLLPNDIQQLKALLLQTQAALTVKETELAVKEQETVELASTVSDQQQKLAAKEQQILELLKALRGKQREHVDPDQLLLFEIGELESIIEEEVQAAKLSNPRRRKRKRRLIPDNIPSETIDHELPESERLCPVDGQVMPFIRWEISHQLDFVPAWFKKIIHRRAVYACPAKHDQATLLTAAKPPEPIDKGLPTAGFWLKWLSVSSATTCLVTAKKTSSRVTASRFVAARSTAGWLAWRTSANRFTT